MPGFPIWVEPGTAPGVFRSPLITMAKTLTRLEDGLLSYFKHRISSGPMQGTNNKIKTVQRQSYGIRDQ